MVKVLLFLGGVAILLVSSRQVFLMFRDGSFRARGNRLIVRNAHPIIFWMNFVGLVLFGVVGVVLICWQLQEHGSRRVSAVHLQWSAQHGGMTAKFRRPQDGWLVSS
jgi:hypothetical protein